MAQRQHDEYSRQLLHVAMGGFALSLRYVAWWQAALLAVAALIFNLFVLPRVAGHLYRTGERAGSARSGIVLYPISVLLLVLLFPYRLDIAAAALGNPGCRRRDGDHHWPQAGLASNPLERREVFCRLARPPPLRRTRRCAARVVVPAECNAGARLVVFGCGAFRRGARGRVCRDDPRQAGRQCLGSGVGRSHAVGAVAGSCGPRRTGARERRSRDRSRHRRQRRCRVAGLSGSYGDIDGSRDRGHHRHGDRSHRWMDGLGTAAGDVPCGSHQLAAGASVARRSSESPRNGADAAARGTRSRTQASRRPPPCSRW